MPQRSRPFYPPKLNRPFVWSLQKIAPWLVRWQSQVELLISSDPTVPLEMLKSQSCLLVCNHPSFHDPKALFLLSSRLEEPFYYLTAYEQFKGLQGWFYQRLGAYSIRRGLADRDSISQTLELLQQPACKLVIFPEGGCSFQNDTVMPFRSGAIQMALQAMVRQVKQGHAVPDLYVIPVSLKYRYTGRMTPVIRRTLKRLEEKLGLPAKGDLYQRLRLVAEAVLIHCEQETKLEPAQGQNWNQRILNLKAEILDRCEARLSLTPTTGEPNRERVYRILNALNTKPNIALDNGIDTWDVMFRAVMRVLNFDAIYDGYVAAKPTPERFLDTLIRLEREVFQIDQPPAKGHRQAFLRVGAPVNLKDYFAAYKTDRTTTVSELTQQIQQTVQNNLDTLAEATARGISW
jgi:1-acyl-sn-glycerol-3-phosphate acyltransferase